jgi:hypothetical protein
MSQLGVGLGNFWDFGSGAGCQVREKFEPQIMTWWHVPAGARFWKFPGGKDDGQGRLVIPRDASHVRTVLHSNGALPNGGDLENVKFV